MSSSPVCPCPCIPLGIVGAAFISIFWPATAEVTARNAVTTTGNHNSREVSHNLAPFFRLAGPDYSRRTRE